MKLSVKLLSGLTLIALVAVAVIGLSHSASAAVDAKVYVTNKASGLTTEPSTAVVGRKSATTVYGTYASNASTGTTARDIVTNSDRFIVTIIDADLNTTTTVTSNERDNLGYHGHAVGTDVTQVAGSGFNSAGDKIQVTLTDKATSPIIGSVSDISVVQTGTSIAVTGVAVTVDFAGDGTNPALLTLQVNYGGFGDDANFDIVYPTSLVNTTTATIKSVVDTGGTAVLTLSETGRNTGRFEGEVWVKERTAGFTAGTNGNPATIPAVGGPITVSYVDAVTSGTATNVARTASYKIDVTSPTATISAPTTASETQNRLPTFTGSVTDAESGIDVSLFSLNIDNTTDALNAQMVISAGNNLSAPTIIGKVASIDLSAIADGTATVPFTYAETVVLPNAGVTIPDHIVDFQVRTADLAGNYGYSDAKTATGNDGTGRHGNQPHTVKIDQVLPTITAVESGVEWDTSVATPVEKENVRDSLVVRFDGKIKDTSVTASDFGVVLSGTTATIVPASVVVKNANVYLDLDTTIPSDNLPTVSVQGVVQDLAGNSTDEGSKKSSDDLSPVITVTRSGGSGTGTGTEAADALTKDKMTITVESDETLQGPPAITVTDINADGTPVSAVGNVNNSTLAVSQGGNKWSLVVSKGASADGSRAVKVVSYDAAGNDTTSGKDITKAYTLDKVVTAPDTLPTSGGTTTESKPFLTYSYGTAGEKQSVTINSATLDTVDVLSEVIASADSKTFFYQPATALTNALHTWVMKATDAAGNTLTTTITFTKADRTDFKLTMFAGWNSVSLPSNPLETGIDSVLSNDGIKQVVAYDATTPSQPWRIASKVGSADYTSQTEPGLTTVEAGPGYWVESEDFEDQTVTLEGPTGPGDARPGLTTIATGNGWNLVGVVDQSRSQTQAINRDATLTRTNASGTDVSVTADTYFNTVANGRAYTFDTVTSKFRSLSGANTLTIGSGIWVFISPQDNGKLPHIVP